MEKSKRQSRLLNGHGQAVIEYVLMLVVSVAMVSALAYQIFRPMREFLKDYMGLYIACLLETGELPSLGNAQTQQALEDEGCNAKFKPASLANGRPPENSWSGGSASAKDPKSSAGEKSDSSESSSTSSGGGGSQSTGRNLLTRSGKAGGDAPKPPDGKVTEIPVESMGSKFYNRKTAEAYSKDGLEKKTSNLDMKFSEDEIKKKERKDNARASINLNEGSISPPKKVSVKPPERKPAEEANSDEGFTIGNFLRILLIAAIIIALVMVLGSQALKIAKSQDD